MGPHAIPRGATGQLTPIWQPSPNFGPRRDGAVPDMVVIHYTAMQGAQAAVDWLCDSQSQVSAHYVIGRDGQLWHLVEDAARAWHAGAGAWGAVGDVNSRSIGIELDNCGSAPFPEPLMQTLERLLARLMRDWAVTPQRVIGHSDLAPGRKIDPGPRFDWRRLARQGVAIWPQPAAPLAADAPRFRALARKVGYTADVPDTTLLAAVRLRFRPWASGPLDPLDMACLADLAQRFPVDRSPLIA